MKTLSMPHGCFNPIGGEVYRAAGNSQGMYQDCGGINNRRPHKMRYAGRMAMENKLFVKGD